MAQRFGGRLALLTLAVAAAGAAAACGNSSGTLTTPALPTRPTIGTTASTSSSAASETTAATATDTGTTDATTTTTSSTTATTSTTTSTTTTTSTSTSTSTSTTTATTTSTVTATPVPTATATSTTSNTSSGSGSALPWILLAVAGAVIAGVLIAMAMRRRNDAAAQRRAGANQVIQASGQLADTATSMPQGNDPATVTVWWQLVDTQQAALTSALAMRTTLAADDPLAAPLTDVEAARSGLADAIATDRRLRLDTPSPADEQLAYSAAVVHERASTLRESAAAVERLLQPQAGG